MSEQPQAASFQPAQSSPQAQPPGRLRLVAVAAVAAVVAIGVYVFATGGFKPKPKLAFVTGSEDAFWDLVIDGARAAAEKEKVELTVVRPKPDPADQSRHVKELMAKGLDGFAVSPVSPAAQAAALDEVAGKGPLVTFDSDAPQSKRRLFVGTDNYAAGQLAGGEVRLAIPDGGAVIVTVGSIDRASGNRRRQGLIDNLCERPFDRSRVADPLDATLKGSQYSIAATVIDWEDQAKAPSLLADALKAHPDVKCVVGLFSYSPGAAVNGIEQAGRAGQVKVVGFDETEATQAGLEAGTIFSSILQDQYRCGYETVRVLADAVRGIDDQGPKGPELTFLNIYVLRADNLDDFRSQGRIRRPGSRAPGS